jgi:hypothetical protein
MAGIKLARLEESGAHPHSSYTEFLRELVAKLLSTPGVVVHEDRKTRAAVIKT